jgi:hypothetical protein
MKASFIVSLALGLATATSAHRQTASDVPYVARAFNSAHADLPRSAGVPSRLANEDQAADRGGTSHESPLCHGF